MTVPGNHLTDIPEDQQEGFELGDHKGAFCDACLHVYYSSVLEKARLTLTARIYIRFAINALAVKISISIIDISLIQKLSTILDIRLRRFFNFETIKLAIL